MSTTQTPFAHTIGSRYAETADLDIADIAKLVRKDIKSAVKAGTLPSDAKYTVRIERYSLGQSLHVTATLPDRPARVRDDFPYDGHYGFTPEADAIKNRLQRMTDAYNYDGSDVMTDYSLVRFYCTPSVDGTRES